MQLYTTMPYGLFYKWSSPYEKLLPLGGCSRFWREKILELLISSLNVFSQFTYLLIFMQKLSINLNASFFTDYWTGMVIHFLYLDIAVIIMYIYIYIKTCCKINVGRSFGNLQRYDFKRLKCRQNLLRLFEVNGFTMPPSKLWEETEKSVWHEKWNRETNWHRKKKPKKKIKPTHREVFNGLSRRMRSH